MQDQTWEIMYLVDAYNARFKKCVSEKERNEVRKVYSRALQIVSGDEEGKIYVYDDFVNLVRDGVLTDYNGAGVFLDWDGRRINLVFCNENFLAKNKYPFIRWFSK